MRTRLIRLASKLLMFIAAALLLVAFVACKRTPAKPTSETVEQPNFVEGHDGGTVGFRITEDGKVHAIVRAPDGSPIEKNVAGALLWRGPTGETQVPLNFENGALVGTGPKLEGDLTEIKYTVNVDGKPWTGALHVPAGGTAQLDAAATAAKARALPKDAKGPNGGVVQVVGDDVVEVVADKKSGQVRMYVLDQNLKPVAVGERKVKLGIVGPTSETVVMTPDRGGLYFTGKLSTKVDPIKITVAVTLRDHTDVVLVNYEPGVVVVVGSHAPPLHVLVVNDWAVDVKVLRVPPPSVHVIVEDDEWHGHGHWGHGHWGHGHRH